MAQKIFNKRTLAILLSLAMLLNGFQVSAMAAGNDTAPEMVQNFEDTYYKQDGTVTTANDWQVHLSKTAAVTDQENVFDITLKVETKDVSIQLNDGAAVLVLDVSSSMAKDAGVCGNCGKAQSHSDHRGTHRVCTYKAVTHLDLLKKAVKSFLDSYVAEAEAGDKRLVAIVKFATNADTVLSWIDVNNEANMATVKNAVDAMGSTNGTNIEAGMVLGRNLLKLPAVSNIPLSNQSLILFSDGSPTVAVGNVNDNSVTKVNSDNRGISSGSSRTSDDLDDILAAVSAKKKAVAYNTDAALLKSVFGTENVIVSTADTLAKDLAAEAGEIVTTKTNASAVIDPMAAGVTMLTVSNQYNTETETWDLSQFAPAVENGITTYTITYRVKLDSKVIAADSNYPGYTVLTPANGATILTYTVGNSEEPVRADFNEPNIRGIIYYTVSYAYVGEVPTGAPAVPGSATYRAGESVTVAANPALENYTFSGWDRADFVMPAANVVIHGQWFENLKYEYTVIYNENNGTDPETKNDSENITDTYENPYEIGVDENTFERENYTFIGWSTEKDGPVDYQPGDEIVFTESGTVELFAQWIENEKYDYSLIYNANFGSNEIKVDAENISGTYATSHNIVVDGNTFVRPNFTFVGWNTEADGSGKSYTVGDKVQLTAQNNTEVLYAQWIENPKYDYSVIYNANFGTDEVKEDAENVKRIYNTTYKIYTDSNTFTRANYTFVGWNTERDGSGKSYTAGEVIALTAQNNTEVLYAQWIENPKYDYSVTYDANFGANQTKSDSENVQGIYQTAYNIKVDRNTFVRVNYTFVGWNTERDGSGKSYTADQTIALTAQDNTKVLYAQWKENPKYDYTLIYNANFDQNETKADAENITAIYAATYSMTVDVNSFRRPNYTFVGWNTEADGSGRSYAPGEKIQLTARNNIEVLYAQWAENPKYNYSVTYDANFGTNETKADAENVVGVYTSAYKISVDANTFVRVNYTFVGWNTERDGSGTAYPVAGAVSLTAQENTKILYAQWIENDKYDYSVFYNANFGEAPEVKADAENVTGTYKTAYDIGVDENTFVRPNYTFIGWSDSADGEVAYAAGDNIHFVEGGSITLYALWAEHDKYSYTVIYNGNGGTLEDGKLAYGDSENVADTYATAHNIIVDANTFAYANHTFIGWNSKADGTGTSFTAEDVIALTTEDNIRTLYAQWKENPKYDYCVSYDANFGEASEVLADAENVTGIYKDTYSITVDENSFLRTGYTFVGWNTERDGSGTAYAADEAIALTAENNTEILYAQWEINSYEYTVNYFVRVEGEVYAPFAGDLSDAPAGETVLFGTVIDKDYLVAKGLPASLADAYHTYNFTAFEGVIVMEEENVVNVYYTAVAVEPPVEEIPDDEVPLSDIPKTGDPIFVYAGMAAVSGIGLICLGGKKKSEEETEE